MKVLIVSDSHGVCSNLELVAERVKGIDMLIHLGDIERDEDYIQALFDCPVHMVRGNNDFFSDLPREEEFSLKNHNIFITHGHYYYVGMSEERLKEEARARGADIAMYGHTHKPALTQEEGLTVLNPGSISYPRQIGRKASYMIMKIDEEGNVDFALKYV